MIIIKQKYIIQIKLSSKSILIRWKSKCTAHTLSTSRAHLNTIFLCVSIFCGLTCVYWRLMAYFFVTLSQIFWCIIFSLIQRKYGPPYSGTVGRTGDGAMCRTHCYRCALRAQMEEAGKLIISIFLSTMRCIEYFNSTSRWLLFGHISGMRDSCSAKWTIALHVRWQWWC